MSESFDISQIERWVARLLDWWQANQKSYPWSETKNPYEVWISEVMLQQTVVSAVPPRYERWLQRWPTVDALARAQEAEVLREWEGLGYYSRGANLWKAAQVLALQGASCFPSNAEELRKLPGVGLYTAAAIASFAFGQPSLTLDANLKRVFQRLNAWPQWTAESEKVTGSLANEAFKLYPSRSFNLALMHLGQQVCRSRGPECRACPLVPVCLAYQKNQTDIIPARLERQVQEKSTPLLVGWRQTPPSIQFFLAQPLTGRFSHLWSFPPRVSELLEVSETENSLSLGTFLHTYTKYKDTLYPVLCAIDEPELPLGWRGRWYTMDEVERLAMPAVHRRIWLAAKKALTVTLPLSI
ncbi:MAG: A/G-specific adenine glycosylase [Spirochaetales bacterium]|nr:A/G-specific adenine glycosylase [Spirochaetales bacterium]